MLTVEISVRLWEILSLLDPSVNTGGWKQYDPLTIENGIAHSYVFDLEDGGRHHAYRDLSHLEAMLLTEVVKEIRRITPDGKAKVTETHRQRALQRYGAS